MSAPTFALIVGLAYIVAGALGFIGSFPVTKLLSALYLAVGLWGGAAWAGATSAVRYARSIAVLFGVLAVLGLVPVLSPFFGPMSLGGEHPWLHAATALIAAYFGFRSLARRPQKKERRRNVSADRRRALRPVAYERRRQVADRRFGAGTLAAG
jgi:Domain of unknown function (DUF4383)